MLILFFLYKIKVDVEEKAEEMQKVKVEWKCLKEKMKERKREKNREKEVERRERAGCREKHTHTAINVPLCTQYREPTFELTYEKTANLRRRAVSCNTQLLINSRQQHWRSLFLTQRDLI